MWIWNMSKSIQDIHNYYSVTIHTAVSVSNTYRVYMQRNSSTV